MTYVQSDKQRLIVEDLFAFGPADFVLDPVLLGIPFIPLEAGAFEKLGQQILHESCIHQTYTTVKNGDAGLSCFSDSVIMPALGFQRKCPSPAASILLAILDWHQTAAWAGSSPAQGPPRSPNRRT